MGNCSAVTAPIVIEGEKGQEPEILEHELYFWDVNSIIGSGEVSIVYKGSTRRTLQKVAVKRTPANKLTKRVINRLYTEASILTTIKKIPHSCRMFVQLKDGFIDSTGGICIVTEFIEGYDLRGLIKNQYPTGVPIPIVKQYFAEILNTLQVLHRYDIAHLDLKLENIMYDQSHSSLKFIDFGFACKTAKFNHETKTKTNILIEHYRGSRHYLAPEIIRRTPFDGKKADIWAVGVILFALCFTRYPFNGATREELFDNIKNNRIAFPSNISPVLEDLFECMLHPLPWERSSPSILLEHPWFSM